MFSHRFPLSVLLSVALPGPALIAQEVDMLLFERAAEYYQESAESIVPSPLDPDGDWFSMRAGAKLSSGSLDDLNVSNGTTVIEVSLQVDDEIYYEGKERFGSLNALNAFVPPGEYNFSGTGSTAGSFSIPFTLGDEGFFVPKKITNYLALQQIDPTGPVTVEWEDFSEYDSYGVIDVEVEYWDESEGRFVLAWETPDQQEGPLPSLPPTANSVTIPAGEISGSSNGVYSVIVRFGAVDQFIEGPGPFDDGLFVTHRLVITHFEMRVADVTSGEWADFFRDDAGNVNTGAFLGWILVVDDWVWAWDQNRWIYLPEANVTTAGAWVFTPR